MSKKMILIASSFIVIGFIGLLLTGFNISNNNDKAFGHEWEYINTDIERIEIIGDMQNIDVTFETSSDEHVYITIGGRSKPQTIDKILQSTLINKTFTVNMENTSETRWISFGIDNNTIQLVILLPQTMLLEDVKMTTKSGNIAISNMSAKTAELESKSGNIHVSDSELNQLQATLKSGDLQIINHNGNIVSKAMSGKLSIDQILGHSEANTASGNVEIEQHGAGDMVVSTKSGNQKLIQHSGGNIEANTKSGNIKLTLGIEFEGNLNTFTKSGSVSVPDMLNFLGKNQHQVVLKTTSGNIKVTQ